MTVESAPAPPTEEDLQAIIEEARRRARKRRLGYVAAVAGLALAGGGLYAAFGSGGAGGDGGAANIQPSPGAASAPKSESTQSGERPFTGERRCPGRGEEALPLGPGANQAAQSIVDVRVGSSPKIDVAIGRDDGVVTHLCGPEIARRALFVATSDHRFDDGPIRSASLAQHRFYVSRFDDGYRAWFWAH